MATVKAFLITAQCSDGRNVQLSKGETLPGDITPEHLAHLLELGLIEDEQKPKAAAAK